MCVCHCFVVVLVVVLVVVFAFMLLVVWVWFGLVSTRGAVSKKEYLSSHDGIGKLSL